MSDFNTPICDLIERLLSHVCPVREVGQALQTARPIEAAMRRSDDKSLERREKDRVRKAAWRAKQKKNVPRTVPGTTQNSPSSLKTKIIDKDSLKEERAIPAVSGDKNGTNRGTTLPESWKPSEEDFHYGELQGLSRAQIEGCAEDMRLWAAANRNRAVAKKSNWTLAFHGWLRREAPKLKAKGQFNGQNREGSRPLGAAGLAATLRRKLADEEKFGNAPTGSSGDGLRDPAPLLVGMERVRQA